VIDLGGSPQLAPERTINPEVKTESPQENIPIERETVESMAEQVEQERLELLLQELQTKVDENPQLMKFKDQISFEITPDGLRIQITDAANRPMFDSGSARLKPYFEDILLAMADTIKAVPNKISVSGHTDAKPYAGQGDFGNWELSANRANAARRALVAGSYPDPQVARVVGFASSQLFDPKEPFNPINRRIDIVVLTKKAQRAIEGDQPPPPQPTQGVGAPGEVPADPNAIPPGQEPLPAHELRQKLNLFDDGGVKDPTVPATGS
jgi:chemotaxis protein MotB